MLKILRVLFSLRCTAMDHDGMYSTKPYKIDSLYLAFFSENRYTSTE